MSKILVNQYKRQDVFRCSHKAHFRFEKSVSVYHVLKEKKCFPEGCIWFLWKCHLLNKGNSCPKGYQHVGRNCFSCKNYFEEKINYQPEILLNEEQHKRFKQELEEFEEWLNTSAGKWVEFSGEVFSVKPHFRRIRYGKKEIMEAGVHPGGTFNANPISIAACKATIRELEKPGIYKQMARLTKKLTLLWR